MENMNFDEEMKKLYCDIEKEKEEIHQLNRQVAIVSAISFVFTAIAIVEMIVSNNDVKNTALGIFTGITSAISFYRSAKRVDV